MASISPPPAHSVSPRGDVTPKIFGLILFIKILPGNKTFPICQVLPFVILDFCL